MSKSFLSNKALRWLLLAFGLILLFGWARLHHWGEGGIAMIDFSDLRVYDFVATNVYWDGIEATRKLYPGIVLKQKENAKFAVIFNRRVKPGEITSIRVSGPDGYALDFDVHRPFERKRLMGYVDDSVTWYMIYDTQGFLKDGEYRISLTWKNGRVFQMSKWVKLNSALLKAYLETPLTFAPQGSIAQDSAGLLLQWPMIAGMDAYYCARVQEVGKDFAKGNAHFDNIFLRGGRAGFNQKEARVTVPLEKGKPYVWFTEILDSNRLREVDMAIFLEFQFFQIQ